jgi:predicted secreted acid phosphatase
MDETKMNNRKEVKQENRIRVSYNQLTGEEKKVYWENFKRMAKDIPINTHEDKIKDQG